MSAHFQRGLVLIRQSRYDLAEKELRLALAEDPDNPQAHAFLALCLNEREEFARATEEARQAVATAPEWPTAHSILAQVYISRNHLDEAEQAAREALRLDPDDPGHYATLARIHLAWRDWATALKFAEGGLAVDAEDVGCANLRAMALTRLGRTEEAAAAVGSALAREPENALGHANLGWNYLHQGDRTKALEHFREALRIDPTDDYAKHGLVEALKARYRLYGLMLRYFLWMGRQSAKLQWVIILGLFFGMRVLRTVADQNPPLRPWVEPLQIAYLVFAVMTWVASPLFNLLLRLNKYGRYALSRDQRLGSTLFGVMLVPALASLAYWAITGSALGMLGSLYFGLLLLPVTAIFRCSAGWPRALMVLYTLVLAGLMPAAILTMPFDPELGASLLMGFVWGNVLSGFVANFLIMARVRR
ncbi:MAG TPA: tetratricopeptide repeat protein [Gemmataceae bacterium]|nr:tetratricopeptide repeat protein [Gemmataceae bacterium]